MLDDITQAVLARDEVVKYLQGGHGRSALQAREQIHAYIDELRTTQRYPIYRALKHPLYPIMRKMDCRAENVEAARAATRNGRVIYVSNHKSHLDYLIEPIVLDDNGLRPPVIAAGINLFGGPLGLIHRHVTGAVPIRRNTKDPAYLITLKAYVSELLRRHDLLFYIEGGRSYSGELKTPKTGLVHAAMQVDQPGATIVPLAVAYDLVLEDRVLARLAEKRRQRPFARELAELVRHAVGYRSRVFVTFGSPIALDQFDSQSRRDVLTLAHVTRQAIGNLYKVLPTAVVATAMRGSIERHDLEKRVEDVLGVLKAARANLDVCAASDTVERGVDQLVARGIVVVEDGRVRVRERAILKYYARTIEHLLGTTGRTH